MRTTYRFEILPNGLVFVEDRKSGLRGAYDRDGRYRHGDLASVPRQTILDAIAARESR